MAKDYEIRIAVKNARLLTKMREHGFVSASALSRACGVDQSRIGYFLNLTESPLRQDGMWRPAVMKICDTLRCAPQDIFPAQHLTTPLRKSKIAFQADGDELAALSGAATPRLLDPQRMLEKAETVETLMKAFNELTTREQLILKARFGWDTEEQNYSWIADALGISGDRVKQLESRAIRKLQCRLRWPVRDEDQSLRLRREDVLGD